jgi:hypothetical protein
MPWRRGGNGRQQRRTTSIRVALSTSQHPGRSPFWRKRGSQPGLTAAMSLSSLLYCCLCCVVLLVNEFGWGGGKGCQLQTEGHPG